MTSRRFTIAAAVVAAIALAGVVTFAALRSRSSDQSSSSATTTSTTTAPPLTTVAPQTIPVPPLPPAGPTTAPPPAITVPPGGTVGTRPPASTTAPSTAPVTVTAAPPSTTSPTTSTTKPTTSTTKPTTSTTKPNKVTRKTVVYTAQGPPKRGDLVVPRQHQDTIVVLVHGGDGSTGSRKQMRSWSDFYAASGYASLAIDYTLAKPSTPSPVFARPQEDVKAAVQYLRNNADPLGINADRVVVQGLEAGAALGAQALVGDEPAAFIGFSGLYDGTQKDPIRYYGGPPDSPNPEVQQRYAQANSIAQAANAAGPALLYADENGDDAAKQSATSFRDALQAAAKDVTLTLKPAAGGAFDEQVAQQVLDWLRARFPPG
ncbi:MAG TPA: alpha/beta hydrolase fold domain-containing protein [Acidimicrobiia bacterium]|nr:alpha/beta hydrolase fold domain-containing protein [Acidimicrobiia bacterium]